MCEWTNSKLAEVIMRKAPIDDLNINWKRVWRLPLFAVVNQKKQTPNDFVRGRVRHSIKQTASNHTARLNIEHFHDMTHQLMKRWARDYLPRLKWRRIILNKVYPGRDSRPRVADVGYEEEDKVKIIRAVILDLAHLKVMSTPPTPLH